MGHALGDLSRHHLQHHRERPGLLQRHRVGQHRVGLVVAALHSIAAELVFALRGESDVAHHRDPSGHDRLDMRREPPAALQLDRVRAAFLHEPDRRRDRLLRRHLVGAEREVSHNESPLHGPGHAPGQEEQFVHRHRQRGVVPVDVVRGGVADQQYRDAGLVEQLGRVHVVCGEHRPRLAAVLQLLQVVDTDPACWSG